MPRMNKHASIMHHERGFLGPGSQSEPFRHAFFLLALTFAHLALCAFAIRALAAADSLCFLPCFRRRTIC